MKRAFLLDLAAYLALMFLVRRLHVPAAGFIANGLFWSLTTLAFAGWRMRARGVSWADLGLRRPRDLKLSAMALPVILVIAIGSIIAFEIVMEMGELSLAPDTSDETAARKFGDLHGNWLLFAAILPFVWLQSAFEELLDRGFLITWIERALPGTRSATVAAVLLQAVIFGFRHSNDLSERSITVGLIGLAMGIGYVAFGRNLWPLVIAHGVLNTVSIAGRVV